MQDIKVQSRYAWKPDDTLIVLDVRKGETSSRSSVYRILCGGEYGFMTKRARGQESNTAMR